MFIVTIYETDGNLVLPYTEYVVIFLVVLFLRISRVRPRENFHFSLCLFTVIKT